MPIEKTAIGWTDSTWNPVHGCSKVSEGCKHCYAARQSLRFGHTEREWTAPNAAENVQLKDHHLDWPRSLSEPRRIFVNSMSDLFHEQVPDAYIHEILDVVEDCPDHVFQALTKHGAESRRLATWERWPDNLWMGVSVETEERSYRIDELLETEAATKWISFEPLVGPIPDDCLGLRDIDWVVVGGEAEPTNSARREMDHAWARRIRDATREQGVPFFFKQSSARYTERGKRLAEKGEDLQMAALLGADSTEYRELPELTPALRRARPDLAAQEVRAR